MRIHQMGVSAIFASAILALAAIGNAQGSNWVRGPVAQMSFDPALEWTGRMLSDQLGNVTFGGLRIRRVAPDGTRDVAFELNSALALPGPSQLAIGLQPSGKVVSLNTIETAAGRKIELRRLNLDGTADLEFGLNGIATAPAHPEYVGGRPGGLHIDSAGRIYATVSQIFRDDIAFTFTQRFTPWGTPEGDFGEGGYVFSSEDLRPRRLDEFSPSPIWASWPDGSYLFDSNRVLPNGKRDLDWTNPGYQPIPPTEQSPHRWSEVETRWVPLTEGRLMRVSYAIDGVAPVVGNQVTLVRYLANGQLDTSFGNGGVLEPIVAGGVWDFQRDSVYNLGSATISGQWITISGQARTIGTAFLLRVSEDGVLDSNMGPKGVAFFPEALGECMRHVASDTLVTCETEPSEDSFSPHEYQRFSGPSPMSLAIPVPTTESPGRRLVPQVPIPDVSVPRSVTPSAPAVTQVQGAPGSATSGRRPASQAGASLP